MIAANLFHKSFCLFIYTGHVHTHVRTHARTHAYTHTHTHMHYTLHIDLTYVRKLIYKTQFTPPWLVKGAMRSMKPFNVLLPVKS